jgi:23S rRNA pseudouridine1911/1915/1917 synthase
MSKSRVIEIVLGEAPGGRLDKALAAAVPEPLGLSRSRLKTLIGAGAVARADGAVLDDPAARVAGGERLTLRLPDPAPARDAPEAIPLAVVHEDDDLIVVDKPAGMVVHPAPGAEAGTLVNALLHHCGERIAGVGGARRPGIVHRIDKDTSGLLVVAKTDRAHAALSAAFKAHVIEREYLALVWGVPDPAEPRLAGLPGVSFEAGGVMRVIGAVGRHPTDRKRMAVTGRGRHAVTRATVLERFGGLAALTACRLETGRTHQIRVHMAHVGHPLIGDPVYGRRRTAPKAAEPALANALASFRRQALHAARLGFVHPRTHIPMYFEAAPPEDFTALLAALRNHPTGELLQSF